jgi:hypothetical protein
VASPTKRIPHSLENLQDRFQTGIVGGCILGYIGHIVASSQLFLENRVVSTAGAIVPCQPMGAIASKATGQPCSILESSVTGLLAAGAVASR